MLVFCGLKKPKWFCVVCYVVLPLPLALHGEKQLTSEMVLQVLMRTKQLVFAFKRLPALSGLYADTDNGQNKA